MESMSRYMSKSRCAYLAFLASYTILREVIPLQPVVGSALLTYGIFGLGMLLIGASILSDRQFLKVYNIPVMILFVGVAVMSMLINFRYAFVDNIKAVGWMTLFFFLVYPSANRSARKTTGDLSAVFFACVITMGILVFISLPMYFLNVDLTYHNDNIIGSISSQGFSNEYMRLWGVFGDANTSAVYAAVTAFMAVYLFAKHRNWICRVLLVCAIVLFTVFIVLSGSRTAYLALVAASAWIGFYLICAGKKVNSKQVLIAVLCAALVAGLGFGVIASVRTVLPYAKRAVSTWMSVPSLLQVHEAYNEMYRLGGVNATSNYTPVESQPVVTEPVVTEPVVTEPVVTEPIITEPVITEPPPTQPPVESLDRNDFHEKGDLSNGRFAKWMDALEIFAASPLIGVSPRGTTPFGRLHCPGNDLAEFDVAAHNTFLEILMGTGLIGFVIVMILLFRAAMRILELAFAEKFCWETMLFGAVALNLICASVFLSDLFFVLTFGGFAFWYALGIVSREPERIRVMPADGEKKRVLIYGPHDPVGGVEKIVFEYVRNIVRYHPDIAFDYLMYGSDFSMESKIRELGCRVLYVPSRGSNMMAYKKAMAELFDRTPYIAVWGNYSGLTNIDLLVLARKHGVPMRIAHSHGSRLYWGNPVMKYVVHVLHYYNKILRVADYATEFWGCSEMAGRFMFPKCVHDRLVIIPNAVDIEKFYPDSEAGAAMRHALGIAPGVPVVGHVARICEVKNQSFLLRVMEQVVKLNPQAKLLFVGDGELREQIEEEIVRLCLQENVIMTGNRPDVPELLRAMNVFVLTSFSEGLSVSTVEAQASGLPCVVPTTVSVETDLIGYMTFLSLQDSPEAWAQAILKATAAGTDNVKEKLARGGYDMAGAAQRLYLRFTMGQAE